MSSDWAIVMNILLIFVLMFVAKLIKEKLGLFKSIVIPTALLAGFLGLIIGPEVLGWVRFNTDFYEKLVFHTMGLGFIALTLTEEGVKHRTDSIKSGLFIISTYCFQGVIGMLVVWGMVATFKPDLFVGLGLMLPLAYGQGPGFASSIGESWDMVLPFGFANQYGLTLSTVGFLVGGIVGVIMLNYYIRKYKIPVERLRTLKGLQSKELTVSSVNEINFFDNVTVQIVWIAIIYMVTYFTILGLGSLLSHLGSIGETIASLIKGFNYLFGIILALLFKKILGLTTKISKRTKSLLDRYMMNNLASLFFNIMITASVMAISIEAMKDYWELLAVISVFGAITSLVYIVWFGRRTFHNNTIHYILAMFGMLTGTASTGLALLRGIDPNLDTDVAQNFVLGSAIAAPLGIPLMIALGLPVIGYTENKPMYYYVTFIIILIYMLAMMAVTFIKSRRDKAK
ncbi:MAG: hypothetical protein GX352_02845 [Clostridiales bacterium]|nr:hypothetical protein [Clostridiales bacterium]